MLLLLLTGQAVQGRDRLYNCTPTHRSVQLCISERLTFFLAQNPKILWLQTEGLFMGPQKINQRIWCIFFSKSLWKVKKEVVTSLGTYFSV